MTTTIHSIPKDEYELGEVVYCNCCNRPLRHYAKSAGEIYGLNCAKSLGLIGKKMTTSKIKHVQWQIDTLKDLVNRDKIDAAYSYARNIDIALKLNVPYSNDYVNQVLEIVS